MHTARAAFLFIRRGAADQWTISRAVPGSEDSGAAWWWLRARLTGSASDRRKACGNLPALDPQKLGADSINRSLIFWYGAALGDLWFGDARARKLAAGIHRCNWRFL